jgi:hypothetical protein
LREDFCGIQGVFPVNDKAFNKKKSDANREKIRKNARFHPRGIFLTYPGKTVARLKRGPAETAEKSRNIKH